MSEFDEIARRNQRHWNNEVATGGIYTCPWLNLDKETVSAFLKGSIEVLPKPYTYIYPQCVFNGLIEAGFVIRGVWEDPRHLQHDVQAKPGTYDHMLTFVQEYFCVLAQKLI